MINLKKIIYNLKIGSGQIKQKKFSKDIKNEILMLYPGDDSPLTELLNTKHTIEEPNFLWWEEDLKPLEFTTIFVNSKLSKDIK